MSCTFATNAWRAIEWALSKRNNHGYQLGYTPQRNPMLQPSRRAPVELVWVIHVIAPLPMVLEHGVDLLASFDNNDSAVTVALASRCQIWHLQLAFRAHSTILLRNQSGARASWHPPANDWCISTRQNTSTCKLCGGHGINQ